MAASRSRSLRLKLAGWFVLVFFVLQTILVVGVVRFRGEAIVASREESLNREVKDMIDSILNAEVEFSPRELASLLPRGSNFVLYAIRDEEGKVLASHGVMDETELPFGALERVPAGPIGGVHRQVDPGKARQLTGREESLRIVTLPFRQNEEIYFFQAAVRDEALDRLLGPFHDLVVLGIPIGVVAATIAAWIIAGRVVAPIHRLSAAAQDLSPESLGERFDVATSDSEIARLEQELNSALARLEAGYRAQDQFLGNVSHELRTPVAVLLTQAQVAKMGERTLDKGYAFVDRAESQLRRLGKVVESVLVLARGEFVANRPTKNVALVDLVVECLHLCREAAEQAGVRLVPRFPESEDETIDDVLRGDAELLLVMLENLVRNAISHSPRDGEVVLEISRGNHVLEIAVRDQGPGIPKEYLERIFDRFVRVPEGSERRDGTGLGLSIANGVAKLHGGTIRVANNPDRGCSFVVRLPVSGSARL